MHHLPRWAASIQKNGKIQKSQPSALPGPRVSRVNLPLLRIHLSVIKTSVCLNASIAIPFTTAFVYKLIQMKAN